MSKIQLEHPDDDYGILADTRKGFLSNFSYSPIVGVIYMRNSEKWNFLLAFLHSGDIGNCASWRINYHKRPLTPERLPFRSWSSSAWVELGRLVRGMPAVALTSR